jgi:hypothetical protein
VAQRKKRKKSKDIAETAKFMQNMVRQAAALFGRMGGRARMASITHAERVEMGRRGGIASGAARRRRGKKGAA